MLKTIPVTIALAGLSILAGTADAGTAPEKDRAAILAMAGQFKVDFKFHETLTLDEGREPSEDETSGAHEKVILVEDRGDFISLQHLLVVDAGPDKMVVKHWRQDWQFEPKLVTEYRGLGQWDRVKVKHRDAKGQWSQTVFSVDDSPRYGGLGEWQHVGDTSWWESQETWRPLPRRETPQHKFYDVLVGLNRHTITPKGWVHEQDNYKLDLNESGNRVLAHETGLNTYYREDGYDFAAADKYWEETKDFWAEVHTTWDGLLADQESVTLRNDGRMVSRKILALADDLREGKFASKEDALKAFHEKLDAALAGQDEEEAPEEH